MIYNAVIQRSVIENGNYDSNRLRKYGLVYVYVNVCLIGWGFFSKSVDMIMTELLWLLGGACVSGSSQFCILSINQYSFG